MSDPGAIDTASARAIRYLLASAKYEIIPLKNAMSAAEALPTDATVTVTASPARGLDATIELSELLAGRGHPVIPHLSARSVRDRGHMEEIVARLDRAGINRAFVVAGDNDEPGAYFDGLSLLEALDEAGHGLTEIGIPCYPEGHPNISDELLLQALRDKSRFAAYMTTQICFDPDTIRSWVKSMRAEGIDLPVHLGLPGVAPVHKLIAISARIGIGNSVRFLSKNTNLVGKLVRPGGYAPDVLILSLASTFVDPDAAIAGLHFYTFNQTKSTGKWRVDFEAELDRLIAGGVTP